MMDNLSSCAECPFESAARICRTDQGHAPAFCPTVNYPELMEKSLQEYERPEIREFARQASIQEAEGYGNREIGYDAVIPLKPRIVEVIEFSRRMNFIRLGLAFCTGLRREASIVGNLLSGQGFEVVSVICKAGRVPKETIGLRDNQKISIGSFEAMCNPILQSIVLNNSQTDFNLLMGLCVGHDSLFFKYSEAPCTVLAVKDRLLGHNPLAAIYTIDSYYRSIK